MHSIKKFFLFLIMTLTVLVAAEYPKHEFRASWIATAWRLDFPQNTWSSAGQQDEIRNRLDALQAAGFNAVVFQIRPGCDAFYASSYEPWSHHLTGSSGTPPNPFYDPLEVFVEEAHTRGMELHAWFNPFRLSTSSDLNGLHPTHVYHEHPEWILNVGTRSANPTDTWPGMVSNTLLEPRDGERETRILNPGLAAVRDYTVDVFMDVVNRYDVDGVHMDDYFYPYEGMSGEDQSTFAADPRGFGNIEDWRRDNINIFMEALYDSIQAVKPGVKLGVSPFGIWRSNYPPGVIGLSSYYDIYCDPIAWLNDQTIDYLTPQLYWPFGGDQDYGALMPWWADSVTAHNRHLYTGQSPYRISDYHNWSANELPRQIRLNRQELDAPGSVFFRLRNGVLDNPKGFLDSLRNDLYRYPAFPPPMPWIDSLPPEAPLEFSVATTGATTLSWSHAGPAADGDTADWYILYRGDDGAVNTESAAHILAVVPGTDSSFVDEEVGLFNYAITAMDRNSNESPAVHGPVSLSDESILPTELELLPAFPNPFNGTTWIRYRLPKSGVVSLEVYDLRGVYIRELARGRQAAGIHETSWDGRDYSGLEMGAGVYFVRLQTPEAQAMIQVLYLK